MGLGDGGGEGGAREDHPCPSTPSTPSTVVFPFCKLPDPNDANLHIKNELAVSMIKLSRAHTTGVCAKTRNGLQCAIVLAGAAK